jgi:hypothetical protein
MMIYGNTLVTPPGNASTPILYGGDQGLDPFYRKGNLYLYNNTLVVRSTQAQVYKINAVELSSPGESLDARNNIFTALPATSGAPPIYGLLPGDGMAYFGRNWVMDDYELTSDNAGFTGHAAGVGNLLVGSTNNPGFANPAGGDYRLTAGSACIDAASRMAGTTLDFLVDWEYLDPHTGRRRFIHGNAADIGAFEFES